MLAWKVYTEEIDRASSKPFTTSTFCCWTLKDREEDRLHQRRGGHNSDGCIHTDTHPTCFDHQNFAKNGRNRCRNFGGGIPLHTHLRPSGSLFFFSLSLPLSLSPDRTTLARQQRQQRLLQPWSAGENFRYWDTHTHRKMKGRGSIDAQLAGTYITACRRRCVTLHRKVRCFQKERKREGLEILAAGRCRVHQKAQTAAQMKQLLAGKNEEPRVWPKRKALADAERRQFGAAGVGNRSPTMPVTQPKASTPLPYIACRVAFAGRVVNIAGHPRGQGSQTKSERPKSSIPSSVSKSRAGFHSCITSYVCWGITLC